MTDRHEMNKVIRKLKGGIRTFNEEAGGVAGAARVLADEYLDGNYAEAANVIFQIQKGVDDYRYMAKRLEEENDENALKRMILESLKDVSSREKLSELVKTGVFIKHCGKLEKNTNEKLDCEIEELEALQKKLESGEYDDKIDDGVINFAAERIAEHVDELAMGMLVNAQENLLFEMYHEEAEKEKKDFECNGSADEMLVYAAATLYGLSKNGEIEYAGEKPDAYTIGVTITGVADTEVISEKTTGGTMTEACLALAILSAAGIAAVLLGTVGYATGVAMLIDSLGFAGGIVAIISTYILAYVVSECDCFERAAEYVCDVTGNAVAKVGRGARWVKRRVARGVKNNLAKAIEEKLVGNAGRAEKVLYECVAENKNRERVPERIVKKENNVLA